MKPAPEPTDSGIVETTTRRRIIPTNSDQSTQTPDLWEYLAKIGTADWARHMLYVYRTAPGPSTPVFKCSQEYAQMPNGQRVQLADQQEMEFALRDNFGGGTFRLLVKRGPQIVTATSTEINAPLRAITPLETHQANAGGGGATVSSFSDSTAQIAGKAIDTIAGQEHLSLRIATEALGATANMVKNLSDRSMSVPAPQDDLMRQFMAVMMQRALAPPPDPLELLTRLLTLQATLNPSGGAAGGPLVEKLLSAAVDRFMAPAPAPGGPPINTGAALVQMLPTIGSQFVEGVRAFAQAREAELKIVTMQRGVTVAPGVNPQVLPPVAPNQPAAPPPNGAPSVDFVEHKIIELLRQPISANQAADEAMQFLETLDPNAVAGLANLGEEGLVKLFSSKPILSQATNNMPRLVEFIRAFLKMHAEDVAAAGGTVPAPTKPPLPN